MKVHCFHCKEKMEAVEGKVVKSTKNGRTTIRLAGKCKKCGTKVSRILSKEQAAQMGGVEVTY